MNTQRLVIVISIVSALIWLLSRLRNPAPVSTAGYTKDAGLTYRSATKRRPVY